MARNESGALGAATIYLTIHAARSLFSTMVFTVNLIYQVQDAHLNPLQLVLVGTALEATAFLCEIPTGIVADVYSRRLSIIIGIFLLGIGLGMQGIAPTFGLILAAQCVWGLGYTFTSGAEQAWISDEVGETRAGQLFFRGAQLESAGGVAGVVFGVLFGLVRLNLPILLGGAGIVILGIFLVVFMPETGFAPTPRGERTTWVQMGDTARAGAGLVRRSPVLLTILGIAAFGGAASEGFDRLSTDHWLTTIGFPAVGALQPVVWFGIIGIVGRVLSVGATEIARRRVDTDSHRAVAGALFALAASLVVGVVAFGLARSFAVALVAGLLVRVARNASDPLQTAWINQHVDSRVRATVFSISSQADAIGQIAGGPVIGAIGLVAGLRAAIVVAGAALSPALALYARTLRRDSPVVVVADDTAIAAIEDADTAQ